MNRREFMKTVGSGVILMGMPGWLKAAETKGKPPNIVYMLCDDLGYGDIRCLNPEGKIATPNVDKLAADGIERHETIPAPVEKTTQKANNEGVMRFIHHLAPAPAPAQLRNQIPSPRVHSQSTL